VFLYAGKLKSKKAPDLLINAFLSLGEENIDLVICGNGELEIKLKSLASGNSNIHFLPFQNQQEMPIIYRIGDVFVLPSRGPGETWGLSVNEAMACGLPAVISRNCGCYPDLIVEGETGFTFINEDELLLKMTLFSDADLIAKMKVKVLNHIAKFNMEAVAVSLEESLLV
jgi:glycosyltransferase involved in cell wall biosynthesis